MTDRRRDADLNWLYRRDEQDTRVFSPEEQESLRRSASAQGTTAPAPGATAPNWQPLPNNPQQPPPPPSPPWQPTPRPRGRGPKQVRRKRRRPLRKFLAIVVTAWLLFLIATPLYAWIAATAVDATGGSTLADQPGTAILLVGSDGRDELSQADRARLGTGDVQGQRADTMMLLYKPEHGRSVVMSFPRDSYVEIPGHGKNRINAAFAFGGPQLLVETVEANTGIAIDGYLEIGFLGVVNAVDAVGGIDVCLDEPIKDRDSHLDLPAGCQTLDGVDALGYVRMRKADSRGDLGRVERQREVISTLSKKVLSPITFINPVRYWKINMAAKDSLARSEGFGITGMINAAMIFGGAAFGSSISLTVPTNGSTRIDGMSVLTWDQEASSQIFKSIISGDTSGLEVFER